MVKCVRTEYVAYTRNPILIIITLCSDKMLCTKFRVNQLDKSSTYLRFHISWPGRNETDDECGKVLLIHAQRF